MFALGVELLMGRAIMARWDDRDRPEWPPHPDRVFMALVASFGESGEDEGEKLALEWLERLGPPCLAVSGVTAERASTTSFVPINDNVDPVLKGKPQAPMGTMPIGRIRQARTFPAVVPDRPRFDLVWPEANLPDDLRPALDRICRDVTYLGHSATPVRVGIAADPGPITLAPTDGRAAHRLRTFGPGRLAALRAWHRLQVRPQPAASTGYRTPAPEPRSFAASPFDPGLIVLRRVDGRWFALESAGMIADALRDELMRRYTRWHGTDAPEWLTGHPPGSPEPSRIRRPAFLPLGFVGREYADGHLLGVAIALPDDFSPANSRVLFDLLARHGESQEVAAEGVGFVKLGVSEPEPGKIVGELQLELDERPPSRRAFALQPETWTRPGRTWATVTPIVMPRFSRRGLTEADVIAGACRDAGYPAPESVRVEKTSWFAGVPHVRSFIRPTPPGRPPRPLTHAAIQFPEPIRGPVLLGAGRHRGYGLCRTIPDEAMVP